MTLPTAPRAIVHRWAERLLLGAGGLCIALALVGWGEAAVFQWTLDWRLERALREGAGAPAPSSFAAGSGTIPTEPPSKAGTTRSSTRSPRPPRPETGDEEPIGRLSAPRLGLSALVAEGVSGSTLRRAVGHVPGSALPWEDGNVALAAHRDTFFWRLKNVKVGDTLRIVTPRGDFEYVVRSLDIVTPERADLIERGHEPRLTLVTCYPFSMVGPAPSRFVVTADRVETTLSY